VPSSLLVPLIVGGVIFLFGIVFVIWGKREEERYYNSLTTRFDLREFFSRWPPRPEPGALKTGGWIAIIVGIVVSGVGYLLWWLNK
jgi:hypothetical protein